MAYSLATSFAGESLLSGFNWFSGKDPSNGYVSYQSQQNALHQGLYSVDPATNVVRLGVDSTHTFGPGEGRPSIRLESKTAYNHGLFIADFLHMPPSQCGVWPAFWAYGHDWPRGGEIDIIEGANDLYSNLISAHTDDGCRLDPADGDLSSGTPRTTECAIGDFNIGCGFDPQSYDTSTYGDGFNAVGGGVYAMQWESDYIRVWHFERGSVPADISRKTPQPRQWGPPQAVFGGKRCDVDSYFKNMNLVININFCGDWGGATWKDSSTCSSLAKTCAEYVAKNPEAFESSYWDVNYIDVYESNGGSTTSPTPGNTPEKPKKPTQPVKPAKPEKGVDPVEFFDGIKGSPGIGYPVTQDDSGILHVLQQPDPQQQPNDPGRPANGRPLTALDFGLSSDDVVDKSQGIGLPVRLRRDSVQNRTLRHAKRLDSDDLPAQPNPDDEVVTTQEDTPGVTVDDPNVPVGGVANGNSANPEDEVVTIQDDDPNVPVDSAESENTADPDSSDPDDGFVTSEDPEELDVQDEVEPNPVNTPVSPNEDSGAETPSITEPAEFTILEDSPQEAESTTTSTSTVYVWITVTRTRPGLDALETARVSNLPEVGDYKHLGCYGSRTGFQTFQQSEVSDIMTVERCIDICDGAPYVGLFEDQCFCAESLDADTRVAGYPDICDHSCAGDSNESCGGIVFPSNETVARQVYRRDAPDNYLLTVYAKSDAVEPQGDKGQLVVPTTITYSLVCPTAQDRLEEHEYVTTLTTDDCGCEDQQFPQIPMRTNVVPCQGCGLDGANSVTLTIPVDAAVETGVPKQPIEDEEDNLPMGDENELPEGDEDELVEGEGGNLSEQGEDEFVGDESKLPGGDDNSLPKGDASKSPGEDEDLEDKTGDDLEDDTDDTSDLEPSDQDSEGQSKPQQVTPVSSPASPLSEPVTAGAGKEWKDVRITTAAALAVVVGVVSFI